MKLSKVLEVSAGRIESTPGKPAQDTFSSITGLKEPKDAGPQDLAFLISAQFVTDAAHSCAGALIVQENLLAPFKAAMENVSTDTGIRKAWPYLIVCADAYLALARISAEWIKEDPYADWHPALNETSFRKRSDGAFVHESAVVHESAKLSPGVVICEGAKIGANVVCLPHVTIGPACEIGEGSHIFPGAVLYPRTSLGKNVRLHSNVVLGSDGFGYARGPRGSEKIWHLGRVIVAQDVEIGPGTCVDRGTLKDTIIERGAKIDNLVQIGHNGHIKSHAILCAQTGLAGNVTVGVGAILAGQAGIADKVEIGDQAIIGPKAGVSKDVSAKETLLGTLVSRPRKQWWKLNALFDRLPELFERVKALEKIRSTNDK